MVINSHLLEAYKNSEVVPFNLNSKFIIMSDCHRGQGNHGDNFLPNQKIFFSALEYYYKSGFTYIELGDGDELWENRKIEPIINAHSDVFWLMSKLYNENRFYMLYGNHDIVKRKDGYMDKNCKDYYYDSARCHLSLFPSLKVHEGLILENTDSKKRIFLVHGHQGDILNDRMWRVSRFLVRYVWRPLELIGFLSPVGSGRPNENRVKIENNLSAFANEKDEIVIAGHTHRPVFSQPGTGLYFNDGSCVHPRCITGIEIENNKIALIKWSICTREDRTLYIGREVLAGPVCISDYFMKK